MKRCLGNNDQHCCWFRGVICPFVKTDRRKKRKHTCVLMQEHGDWDKVLEDERYIEIVQPLFDTSPELKGMNCRDWPQNYPEVMKQSSGKCCWDDD